MHPTHRLIFAQARAVRASSAVPFVYPPVQLGKRLFVDGGLVRNLAWDAFGHWGVARKSNRKRRWVPRRRRAVLALSIRGPDRAWAEDFSLRGGDGEEEDDEPAPPRRAFFPFFAGPDEEQETLRRRALNRRGFAGLRAGRKANFTAPSCRVIDLRAIDAASARWRGGEGLSPLDLAGGAASSPRNEFARCVRLTGRFARRLWAFGTKLLELVAFGADSPNALPPDGANLDVVKIDTLDVQAAEFDLGSRERAHLVASGYLSVARHLEACGHGRSPAPPPWLVGLLRNASLDLYELMAKDAALSLLKRGIRPQEAVKPTVYPEL